MDLYLHQNGRQLGPFPAETVQQMLGTGALSPSDLVWHEGAPDWVPLSAFFAALPPPLAGRPASLPPLLAAAPPVDPAVWARQLAGINGVHGLTQDQLRHEVQRGGRFVLYQFCISVLVMSFKRSSGIHFIRGGQSTLKPGLGYCAISFFCGWWGIPWGPIWTISTLTTNLSGGKDVTPNIVTALKLR